MKSTRNDSKRARVMVDSGHHHGEKEDSNEENVVNDYHSGHHIHLHFHHHHYHHNQNESNDNEEHKPVVKPNPATKPSLLPIDTTKGSFRIHCKADSHYFLSIVDGMLVLALSNPDDDRQRWHKMENSTVKSGTGQPAFALVNKATNQLMRSNYGKSLQVELIPYNPDVTLLWVHGKDKLGYDGYKPLIPVVDRDCNLDADSYACLGGQFFSTTNVGGGYQLWKFTN